MLIDFFFDESMFVYMIYHASFAIELSYYAQCLISYPNLSCWQLPVLHEVDYLVKSF